ncbi:MAG: YicC family protein [Spirochaetales bacterium]|nr:YicC family protein [Spirochaetales bacterium]
MRSMTGYGTSEYSNEKIRISVELKAYNNKYLDLTLNMPVWMNPLENIIREKIKSYNINRGRIEINIRVKELIEDVSITIDHNMAKEVIKGFKELIAVNGISEHISISDVMNFEGIIKSDKKRDLETINELLLVELDIVLKQFLAEKEREGLALKNDIYSSLERILSCVEKSEKYIPQIEAKIKEGFVNRFKEVLGDDIDENRILTELGVLLVKYDINEEIVRLKSHISNFKESSEEVPCGKKLDFICQEMNREINTIGSKSPLIEISQLVVDMKNDLEQIREQARNVE